MDQRLQEQLRAVAGRYRSLLLWKSLAWLWLVAALVCAAMLWLRSRSEWLVEANVFTIGTIVLLFALGLVALASLAFRRPQWAAYKLEQQFPDLEQRLITALSQRPNPRDGSFGYLQFAVLHETLTHAHRRPWTSAVSDAQLMRAKWANLPAALLLAVVLTGLWTQRGPALSVAPSNRHVLPGEQDDTRISVDPGDFEIERGGRLTVVARFAGTVPKEAELVVSAVGQVQRQPMTRSLQDPLFSGQLLDVQTDLTYHVAYPGGESRHFRVSVFEYPRLVRSDARIVFPAYTSLDEKLIEDARRVTAVEGAELTWLCHLNKPVQEAKLVDEDGGEVALAPDSSAPNAYSAAITLTSSRRWTLHLVDSDGRPNQYPPQLVATVVPNKPPAIKLTLARDLRVSPIEEVPVQAAFEDDFGLVRYGLSYTLGVEAAEDVVLGEGAGRQEKRDAAYLLDFEALGAEPDQLLSYHFWAEDYAPDGQIRRIESDMYFAEVRHFEEIFREGQQPAGGQSQQQEQQQQGGGQNAQQAEQLADLQKQIITGTWNIIRRETQRELSAEFVDDVTLLSDSQASAIEQVEALSTRLTDEQSQEFVAEVLTYMRAAVEHLSAAVDGPLTTPLRPALAAEQASYQGLLRLRAREHEVVRGQQQQQQGGGQSSSGANQQFREQLQQLELRNQDNRYQTEQQAQAAEENPEQREMRQVLNRLRELAQRQQDLNEQLQQLQTALQQAETEEEREQIERQLKRLRDQQEEMLRDTDELAERMNEASNQSDMQQAQQRVEEARENVRQSAEALGERNVSQALSSGTRAERQLEEVRDEFRRRAANQFSETMQEMREQARELDSGQQRLGEQLADLQQESRGSLRGDDTRQQLRDQLQEQKQELEDLLNRMRQTVQNAESTEPLLAESLYEAHRQAQQLQLAERLDMTSELLRSGLDPQARQLAETARQGVTDLRQNIERAAEQVLGDETEALRRALGELERLSRELNQEIDREDPRPRQDSAEEGGRGRQASERGGEREGDPASDGEASADRTSDNGQFPDEQQSRQRRDTANEAEGRPADGEEESQNSSRGEGGPQSQQGQTSGEREQQDVREPSDQDQSNGQRNQSGQAGQPSQNGGQGGGGGGGDPQDGEREREQDGQFDPTERDPSDATRDQQLQRGNAGGEGGAFNDGGAWNDGGFDDGGLDRFSGDNLGAAPITGDSFRDWSDRLRDVEEIVGDPELRSEATRIRERARDIRRDLRREGQKPQWDLVRRLVAEPLDELRQRVSEELLRRSAEKNSLVPIDRDPVPDQFTEQVRRYYERLGSGD